MWVCFGKLGCSVILRRCAARGQSAWRRACASGRRCAGRPWIDTATVLGSDLAPSFAGERHPSLTKLLMQGRCENIVSHVASATLQPDSLKQAAQRATAANVEVEIAGRGVAIGLRKA